MELLSIRPASLNRAEPAIMNSLYGSTNIPGLLQSKKERIIFFFNNRLLNSGSVNGVTYFGIENNYVSSVNAGALLPLDDLLDRHAPATKALFSNSIWDGMRVDRLFPVQYRHRGFNRQTIRRIEFAGSHGSFRL